MAAQLCQLALRPARRRGRVVVAIRCRDGRRVARRSDDGSLAFRGVAFVRAARAAWSISLRTQRSLRRRTVDTSHVQVATQRHAALPSGARHIGTRTGCRPRAFSRRGVIRSPGRDECDAAGANPERTGAGGVRRSVTAWHGCPGQTTRRDTGEYEPVAFGRLHTEVIVNYSGCGVSLGSVDPSS